MVLQVHAEAWLKSEVKTLISLVTGFQQVAENTSYSLGKGDPLMVREAKTLATGHTNDAKLGVVLCKVCGRLWLPLLLIAAAPVSGYDSSLS